MDIMQEWPNDTRHDDTKHNDTQDNNSKMFESTTWPFSAECCYGQRLYGVCRGVIRKWVKAGPKLRICNNKIFPKDKRTSLLCPGVNFDPGKLNNIWRRMLYISSWPLL